MRICPPWKPARPPAPFEVVALWRSEQERKEWVARPIHDEVFAPVIDAADSISWTVQSVEGAWGGVA